MKKIILILFFASVCVQTQVETRTLNNGNLILEDVPNVPEEIKKELKGYQNIRSASFGALNLIITEYSYLQDLVMWASFTSLISHWE